MRLVYNHFTLCDSSHPNSTRMTHPALFGPGGKGWDGVADLVVADIRRARSEAPGLSIIPLIHMRGGALRHERFRLDSPGVARRQFERDRRFLLGDTKAQFRAFERMVYEADNELAVYEGAHDTGASATEDPVKVWEDASGELARSGMVSEWIFDATAGTFAPQQPGGPDSSPDEELQPDPRILRLFDHIERRYGHVCRCEGWALRHNWALARKPWRGVCCRDNVYCRSVQHPHTGFTGPLHPTRPLSPIFLPRTSIGGTAMLVCIDAGRDPIKDALTWTKAHPLNVAAVNLQGLHAADRSARELLEPAEVMAT